MKPLADVYERIAETTPAGLWVLDDAGRTLFFNHRASELLGRTPEQMELLEAHQVVEARSWPAFEAHLRTLDAGAENGAEHEWLVTRPDETAHWLLMAAHRVVDDDGSALYVHWLDDPSARDELRQELLHQRQELADAQRIARVASWRLNPFTGEISWSDAMYDLVGWPRSEPPMTLEEFAEHVLPEDRPALDKATEDAYRTGEMEHEVRFRRPDGQVVWIHTRGSVRPDRSGKLRTLLATSHDVTHQKETEDELVQAVILSHLLRTLTSDANDSATLGRALDRMHQRAIELDPGARMITFTPVVGEDGDVHLDPDFPGRDYSLLVDEQRRPTERERACALRIWETGELQIEEVPEDGTVELGNASWYDGEVVVIVVLSVVNTFSSYESRRALLEWVSTQLSRVVERERTNAELATTRDAALEASRQKSAFLATMSHEIRTPLNGVIGLNDLLLRTELDGNQRRITEGVQAAGRSLLAVLNDILDFSKIEAGKLELETVDFDIRDVIDRAASLLGERANEKGIELAVTVRPDVPQFLRGDPTRLSQVLTNLLSNAVKFTAQGEVIVRCDLVEHPEETGGDPDEVMLRMQVTDTGAGIPLDKQDSLFDAFSQAEMSTTRRYGGTGLGLAICRQLVSAIGGQIGVVSEPEQGSTFWFTGRFHEGDPVAALDLPARSHVLVGRRILIVDDNASNRHILADLLDEWSVEVEEAEGALEAVAMVRAASVRGEPFDVVLLDLVMPDHDGLELAQMITSTTDEPWPTMVLLSSAQTVDQSHLAEAGISVSLTKPVGRSTLFDGLVESLAELHGIEHVTQTHHHPVAENTGKHLLVVEDNEINHMVALGALEVLGYTADVAVNGEEAVEMAARRIYDGILMDVQMPLMDGYTATRLIREAEPDEVRVPIVAMTAAAVEGERERCLEAGMDDFLTKPVEPSRLQETLRAWVQDGQHADVAAGVGAGAAAEAARPPIVDRSRLDVLRQKGARADAMVLRIVEAFVSQAAEDLTEIRAAVDSGDAPRLSFAAHRLKGSAANVGAVRLAEVCLELELAARAGSADATDQQMAELADAVQRTTRELEADPSG